MASKKTFYSCQQCGQRSAKWLGRCTACGEWNSFVEEREADPDARASLSGAASGGPAAERAVALVEVDAERDAARLANGSGELDRVLGGGMVGGSAVLLGGDPGIGKSTLALQVAGGLAGKGSSVLYVSGEESAEQIRLRAERLVVRLMVN